MQVNTSFATASCILLDRTATAAQCISGVWSHFAIASCILLDRTATAAQCISGIWAHFATASCILFDRTATSAHCISGFWSHFATASCILNNSQHSSRAYRNWRSIAQPYLIYLPYVIAKYKLMQRRFRCVRIPSSHHLLKLSRMNC